MNEEHRNPTLPTDDEQLGPRKLKHKQTPWCNQRWLLVVTLLLGIGVIGFALSGVSEEVAGVNDSIQEQTEAIEEHTGVLVGLRHAVNDLTDAVEYGVQRLVDEIRSAAEQVSRPA